MLPAVQGAFFKLHQWMGLAAAALLFVLGITGSALVFENEIDRALNPSTSYVTPQGRLLPLSELVARANVAKLDDPIGGIRIADRPDQAYELTARIRHSVMVDPYTGAILGTRDRERSFARNLHLLHTRFLGGEIGETVAGWLTLFLLALAVSGLILWWPRRIVAFRAGSSSWKRTNFDLHNVLGFYSSVVLVVIALSGALIAFERTTDPLVLKLNGAKETDVTRLRSTPIHEAPIPLEAAVAVANGALPGAFATNISVPSAPTAVYRILLRFPEDRTPAGRSRVYLDQFTGKVLAIENTRDAQRGRRILNLKRSLHTGDIFGAPTRALYFVVSLGLALQAVTGVLIWWNSRKRSGSRAAQPAA
jgi:uncharacterized iron-regulated membrane protein